MVFDKIQRCPYFFKKTDLTAKAKRSPAGRKTNESGYKGGNVLPIVKIDMIEGRTDEQKKNMIREVTEAISKTADAKPETITIIINDLPKINIAKAGKSLAETA